MCVKKNLIFTLIFISIKISLLFCQSAQDSSFNFKRGLQIHPFEKQIGFRSNLDKKHFIDFKGGLNFSALPFMYLELNVFKRFVNKNQTKVYWGTGLTLNEFVFGFQFPLGIEFSPIQSMRQLTIITELAPRFSFSKSYFLNLQFYPHIGVCYYFHNKSLKK